MFETFVSQTTLTRTPGLRVQNRGNVHVSLSCSVLNETNHTRNLLLSLPEFLGFLHSLKTGNGYGSDRIEPTSPTNYENDDIESRRGSESLQHIHDLQLQVRQKTHNLNRLEAQRNDLNSKSNYENDNIESRRGSEPVLPSTNSRSSAPSSPEDSQSQSSWSSTQWSQFERYLLNTCRNPNWCLAIWIVGAVWTLISFNCVTDLDFLFVWNEIFIDIVFFFNYCAFYSFNWFFLVLFLFLATIWFYSFRLQVWN